jgi:hypothetical protein
MKKLGRRAAAAGPIAQQPVRRSQPSQHTGRASSSILPRGRPGRALVPGVLVEQLGRRAAASPPAPLPTPPSVAATPTPLASTSVAGRRFDATASSVATAAAAAGHGGRPAAVLVAAPPTPLLAAVSAAPTPLLAAAPKIWHET